MEHQLKLHSENLQSRIEELEKENAVISLKCSVIQILLHLEIFDPKKTEAKDKKDSEINNLKLEIQNMKHILKSYEEQALKISDLEKKLRNQNTKHEKEMKSVEEKYKDKLKSFSKKIAIMNYK